MAGRSPHAGTSDLVALGVALRTLRERRGVRQDALDWDAGLGRGYVSAAEVGHLNPAFLTLLTLARTLRAPLAELVDLYARELARIDPQAGHDVPACPTPAALAYAKRMSERSLATQHARKARRARQARG